MEYLPRIADGDVKPEKQDDTLSSYAPMISKQEGEIDFMMDAEHIERQIRAMGSWPGAFTWLGQVQMKIISAQVANFGTVGNLPGTVVSTGRDGIIVACNKGMIVVKELQI